MRNKSIATIAITVFQWRDFRANEKSFYLPPVLRVTRRINATIFASGACSPFITAREGPYLESPDSANLTLPQRRGRLCLCEQTTKLFTPSCIPVRRFSWCHCGTPSETAIFRNRLEETNLLDAKSRFFLVETAARSAG